MAEPPPQEGQRQSPQGPSAQQYLLLRQGRPHQDLGGNHEVLGITSTPAETCSSPFPKMLRPLSGDQRAPKVPLGLHWDSSHLRLSPGPAGVQS